MAKSIADWSQRRLADFVADNSSSDNTPGILTLGPYENSRHLGILCTEPMTLSNRIEKRSKTSSQTYTIYYRKNGTVLSGPPEVVVLAANDLFEVALTTDDGEVVDGRIYISFEVT